MTLTKKILPLAALLAVALPGGSAMAAPKSKFRFAQATYVSREGDSVQVVITRAARHGHSRKDQVSSVNWSITGGTATSGSDYDVDTLQGKLTFASGETSKTLTFDLHQDTEIENLETIGLKLSAASNNALITNPRTSQILIADDDGPQQLQVVAAAPTVAESAASADFYVVRSGATADDADVDFATSNGTAVAPGDFTATSGSFHFGPTDFSKTISVPLGHDTLPEDPESFSMVLSNLRGATATFPNGATTVSASTTIVDDDAAPQFELDASSYEVNEDGSVDVTVQRLTSAASAQVDVNDVFNVTWATTDGTATNPADYVPGADQQLEFDSTDDAETITIAANDADTQIGLIDDTLAEGDETFGLSLQSAVNAPGGSGVAPSIGSPSSANVTIHDNDTPAVTGSTGGSTDTGAGAGTDQGAQAVLGARQAACGLTVKAAKKQKLLKQKVLKLKLRSGQRCKVTVTTTIKKLRSTSKKRQAQIVRALKFTGKKASLTLKPGKATTVKVKFTTKTLKAIKKALRARNKLVATVVLTSKDSASKVTRKTLKITIRG